MSETKRKRPVKGRSPINNKQNSKIIIYLPNIHVAEASFVR